MFVGSESLLYRMKSSSLVAAVLVAAVPAGAPAQNHCSRETLTVNVKDFGTGMSQSKKGSQPGLGLIAMRERAEILCGHLQIMSSPNAGTTVSLVMPLELSESAADTAVQAEELNEVLIRDHD